MPPLPAAPAAQDAVVEQLQQRLGDCQKSPEFLTALGHLLNQRGRYAEASDHLERALMLDPDLQPARVDYAISLAGVGDLLSALGLVDGLLAEPDLPLPLRNVLSRQRAAWFAPSWQRRITTSLRLGYDSNLRGAPNLTELSLTSQGQSFPLTLDETFLAKPGLYARADAQLELRRDEPEGGRWELYAGLRSRRSAAVPESDSSQYDLALERSQAGSGAVATGGYLGVTASGFQAKLGVRYSAQGLAAGWLSRSLDYNAQGCEVRTGAELQNRSYTSNDVLSGRYIGLAAVWACNRGQQWLVQAKVGRDLARSAARPGGDQAQYSLRAATYRPLARGALIAETELSYYQDRRGYSEFLESGRTRNMRRVNARLEYQLPLGRSVQWIVGGEWVHQASNLNLFNVKSWGPYTTLRSAW